MKRFALALTAVGTLILVAETASASDKLHGSVHDNLQHRSYHRELDHRSAHRYGMTGRQHFGLHRSLQHEATHDALEHRATDRQIVHRDAHQSGINRWQHSRLHSNLRHEAVHDRVDHRATHRVTRPTYSRGLTVSPRGIGYRSRSFSLFFGR